MRQAVFFIIGLILIEIGIRGKLGSMIGALIAPDYMQET